MSSISTIPFSRLVYAFIPVFIICIFFVKWSLSSTNLLYAVVRMLSQLLLVGFFLSYVFGADSYLIVLFVSCLMISVSAWIALRTVKSKRKLLYSKALISIFLGGGFVLFLMTQVVLQLSPWYYPRYFIPLAGMIFFNAINSISLAAERYFTELDRGLSYFDARKIGLQTSLIPILNSFFAVGLVSLPGMMTGQILSGTSPFIAARYQIMVMCMVFGSAGLSSLIFLYLLKKDIQSD